MQLVLTAEPIDAQRALQCNLVIKVVPHDRLMAESELLARQILRNSQRAVRSAKETILEVIGKPLDDQLRMEGWNSYTCVDRDEARALLRRFRREDRSRSSRHPTNIAVTCRHPGPTITLGWAHGAYMGVRMLGRRTTSP